MSKQDAIRTAAYHKFVELAPKRLAGEFGPIDTYLAKGNTAFRIKGVCQYLCDTYGLKMSQTSPHYNFALQTCRGNLKSATLPARPELCVGLGRPLDKLGGRKPNNAAKVAAEPATETAGEGVHVVGTAPAAVLGAAAVEAQVAAVEQAAANVDAATETQEPAVGTEVAAQQEAAVEQQEEQAPAVELVNVVRKKDGTVVLEQVTREVAEAAIDTAKKKKQAALAIV